MVIRPAPRPGWSALALALGGASWATLAGHPERPETIRIRGEIHLKLEQLELAQFQRIDRARQENGKRRHASCAR
jgi:hypothetical protein